MADTVNDTLAERGNRYGDFTDHARISQELQDVMRATPGWAKMTPVMREGLILIVHKIARACNGDPFYADNWHDIQGYAKLVEDRCGESMQPQSPPGTGMGEPELDWINWTGGEPPVDGSAWVDVKFRRGSSERGSAANRLTWTHGGGAWDIIQYRLAK